MNSHGKKILGAVISSLIFSLIFVVPMGFLTYFKIEYDFSNIWYIIWMLVLGVPVLIIMINLGLRIKEIIGGEEDEASKY